MSSEVPIKALVDQIGQAIESIQASHGTKAAMFMKSALASIELSRMILAMSCEVWGEGSDKSSEIISVAGSALSSMLVGASDGLDEKTIHAVLEQAGRLRDMQNNVIMSLNATMQ